MLALVLLLTLASCAASFEGAKSVDEGMRYEEPGWVAERNDSETKSEDPSASDLGERKQIFRYKLSLQTVGYDELLSRIRTEAKSLGGFVESLEEDQYNSLRSATLEIRVPAEKAEAFTDGIAGAAVVTSRSVSSEDVTMEYVDVETRIANLESERQALNAMMEKAVSVDDLITIQSRLSDVQYELESYTARRNKLAELVGLSEIVFYVREVAQESELEKTRSIWEESGSGFINTLRGLGVFFRNLFVGFVSALPVLLILAAILLAIILPVRRSVRKKKAARAAQRLVPPPPPPAPPAGN